MLNLVKVLYFLKRLYFNFLVYTFLGVLCKNLARWSYSFIEVKLILAFATSILPPV